MRALFYMEGPPNNWIDQLNMQHIDDIRYHLMRR